MCCAPHLQSGASTRRCATGATGAVGGPGGPRSRRSHGRAVIAAPQGMGDARRAAQDVQQRVAAVVAALGMEARI